MASSASRLTLGTANLGQAYGIAGSGRALSRAEVDEILRTSLELGVRNIDTAPAYGDAERHIGDFLKREGAPDDLAICTKLEALPAGLSNDEISARVEGQLSASRMRLGRDVIDTFLLHDVADLRQYGSVLVDVLEGQREAGRVSRIGVAVYEPEDVARILRHPEFSAVQFPFNLFDRRLKSCWRDESHKASVPGPASFARSPLLQGLFALRPQALPRRVAAAKPWLEELDRLMLRYRSKSVPVALAFALAQSGADQIVLGVDSAKQLREAVESLQNPLPDGFAADVEQHFADVPSRVRDPRRWA